MEKAKLRYRWYETVYGPAYDLILDDSNIDYEYSDCLAEDYFYRVVNHFKKKYKVPDDEDINIEALYLSEPIVLQRDDYRHYYLELDPINNYGLGINYPYPIWDSQDEDFELDEEDDEVLETPIRMRVRLNDFEEVDE